MPEPIPVGANGVTIYRPSPDKAGRAAPHHRICWRRADGTRRNLWRRQMGDALEVAQEVDRQLALILSGRHDPTVDTYTMSDLAKLWLNPNSHPEPWSVLYAAGCRSLVDTWIEPHLGHVPIGDVTPGLLREFINDIRARQPRPSDVSVSR